MFEKQWGGVEEDIDIEGWRVILSFFYRGDDPHYGWILTGHNICNGQTTTDYKDGKFTHRCLKCGISCPKHVREQLLTLASAHNKGFPV